MKTNYKNLLLSLCFAISTIAYSQQVAWFDLGGSTQHTGSNYNNIDDVSSMTPLGVINSTGAASGFTITLTDAFIDKNFNGAGGSGNPAATGDAAMFDVQATRDSFFGSSNHGGTNDQLGTFEFTGLNNSNYYSFTIYAGRIPGSSVRTAEYEFVGSATSTGVLNASDNSSNVVMVNNVQPTGGKITLNVSPDATNTHASKYFYIGALKMEETTSPLSVEDLIVENGGLLLYPNPAKNELNINYILKSASKTSIAIYDISGRLIFNANNGLNQPGTYSFKWNRLDNDGSKPSSGMYLVEFKTETNTITKKLVLK